MPQASNYTIISDLTRELFTTARLHALCLVRAAVLRSIVGQTAALSGLQQLTLKLQNEVGEASFKQDKRAHSQIEGQVQIPQIEDQIEGSQIEDQVEGPQIEDQVEGLQIEDQVEGPQIDQQQSQEAKRYLVAYANLYLDLDMLLKETKDILVKVLITTLVMFHQNGFIICEGGFNKAATEVDSTSTLLDTANITLATEGMEEGRNEKNSESWESHYKPLFKRFALLSERRFEEVILKNICSLLLTTGARLQAGSLESTVTCLKTAEAQFNEKVNDMRIELHELTETHGHARLGR